MQQNPSPVITQASTVHLPSPVTPVLATPVSSPRVTPHAAGVFGLPVSPHDTPRSSRHGQHSRRAASPVSTIDSLERHGTPELDGTPLIYVKGAGEGHVKHRNHLHMMIIQLTPVLRHKKMER